MAYELEGRLLEVCTCNVLCPCWVGADSDAPDGTCDAIVSWCIDKGNVNGLNVSGLTIAVLCHIPENIMKGNWRVVAFVDDKASQEQQNALLSVFTGKLGGPVADLAKLIGEVAGVERAPIKFDVQQGKGRLKIGSGIEAEMEPFTGGTGKNTALTDTVFSTIPGSPAYVSKATHYKAKNAALGFNIDLRDHNAVQGKFHFQA
jgi:hypothetical protein